MKNAFLFHLKSSSHSQDVLTFSHVEKNILLRKIKLISKFMTSQPVYQLIVIRMLSNISRSKDNQTMKFGQLTEYSNRNIFLQKS